MENNKQQIYNAKHYRMICFQKIKCEFCNIMSNRKRFAIHCKTNKHQKNVLRALGP